MCRAGYIPFVWIASGRSAASGQWRSQDFGLGVGGVGGVGGGGGGGGAMYPLLYMI